MKIKEVLLEARSTLTSRGLPEASLEAEILVRHALSLERARFYASLEEEYGQGRGALSSMIDRRLRGEPLAYILGQREFFGAPLQVNRHVLVPRQETELLVEKALELAWAMHADQPLLIADVGTGSGAIAVALAAHLPGATIFATDISHQALQIAASNARWHGLGDRIRLLHGDLLEPLPEPVDILVANLPYIPTKDIPVLAPEVLHEPRVALDGGAQGMDVITRLLHQAPGHTKPHAAIVLEIDPSQAKAVVELAEAVFPGARTSVNRDLSQLDRAVVIRRVCMPP